MLRLGSVSRHSNLDSSMEHSKEIAPLMTLIKNPRSFVPLNKVKGRGFFIPPDVRWEGLFVLTLQNVFWVTYNCSYKYACTCAFMHLFIGYASPNH